MSSYEIRNSSTFYDTGNGTSINLIYKNSQIGSIKLGADKKIIVTGLLASVLKYSTSVYVQEFYYVSYDLDSKIMKSSYTNIKKDDFILLNTLTAIISGDKYYYHCMKRPTVVKGTYYSLSGELKEGKLTNVKTESRPTGKMKDEQGELTKKWLQIHGLNLSGEFENIVVPNGPLKRVLDLKKKTIAIYSVE